VASYTITVPTVPPSLNQVLRMHWAKKRLLKKDWIAMIAHSLLLEGWRMKKVDVKQRVVITIHNARTYDKDNAYGSCKVILDAMKTLELLVDDRKEWLDVDVKQEPSTRKDKRTVIEIGPAEAA
jgi:hypothetical protein